MLPELSARVLDEVEVLPAPPNFSVPMVCVKVPPRTMVGLVPVVSTTDTPPVDTSVLLALRKSCPPLTIVPPS